MCTLCVPYLSKYADRFGAIIPHIDLKYPRCCTWFVHIEHFDMSHFHGLGASTTITRSQILGKLGWVMSFVLSFVLQYSVHSGRHMAVLFYFIKGIKATQICQYDLKFRKL